MCRVLDCQPGDLLEWVEDEHSATVTNGDPLR